MIQMRREQHGRLAQVLVPAAQYADRVPCVFLLEGGGGIKTKLCVRGQRFERLARVGADLQQTEIRFQAGSASSFDLRRQGGQMLASFLETSSFFRAGGCDRGNRA